MSVKEISENSPKAWKDFLSFYRDEVKDFPKIRDTNFEELPYLMQIGLLIGYLQENGVEPDIANFHLKELELVLQEAFLVQENNLSHYS